MSDERENSAAKRSLPTTMSVRSMSSPMPATQAARVEQDGHAEGAGALGGGDVGRRVAAVDQQDAGVVQQVAGQLAGIERGRAAAGVADQPPPGALVDQDERRRARSCPAAISTGETSTPNAFMPRQDVEPNSSSERRPK